MTGSLHDGFGTSEVTACRRLIEIGLEEDLGNAGDLTSRALVPESIAGAAAFVTRQQGVLAGLVAARMVFEALGPGVKWETCCEEGCEINPGQVIARVSSAVRSLLAAERTGLNFVQRLSGIATLTRRYVDAIAGLPCRIYDTRKTTPGWRLLEKYAVRVGGGCNHRMGLYDAVLIKDNHLVAWQLHSPDRSLATAVQTARAAAPAGTVVEIEVDTIEQLEDALGGEPDIVLLDNMSFEALRQAVALRNQRLPRLVLEASGGITLGTVRRVAETGVDRISVGAITHSAPALDIALDFDLHDA